MDASLKYRLQNIFRCYEPALRSGGLPIKHLKALDAITSCATPSRGTSVYHCDSEQKSVCIHHACRHRSCWQCSQRQRHEWVVSQSRRLLTCSHFHVVFTLPQEYRVLWRYNQGWFTRTYFRVVSQLLLELIKDPKHLGVTPGILMSLHTWGRQLSLHPHLHCVVTGGGLDRQGQWQDSGDYLLPVQVVKRLYRARMQSALKEAFADGELLLPPDHQAADFQRLQRTTWRREWNVRIEPRYNHGHGVMKYLSRYLRGGPIHPSQIVRCDAERIDFRYQDHRDGRHKVMSLKSMEFVRRLMVHIPEPGQHVVRHYGLYGGAGRAKRLKCREQLGGSIEPMAVTDTEAESAPLMCRCGGPLRHVITLRGTHRKGNSLVRGEGWSLVQQVDEPVSAVAKKTSSLTLRL